MTGFASAVIAWLCVTIVSADGFDDGTRYLSDAGFLDSDDPTNDELRDAIERFQKFMGLSQTGKLDDDTIRRIDDIEESTELSSVRIPWDHQTITWCVRGKASRQEREAFRSGMQLWNATRIFEFREIEEVANSDIVIQFSNKLEFWDLAVARKIGSSHFLLDFNGNRRDDWIPNRDGKVYLRKYTAYLVGVLLGLETNNQDRDSVMSRRVFDDIKPVRNDEIEMIRRLYPKFKPLNTRNDFDIRRPFDDPLLDDGSDDNNNRDDDNTTDPRDENDREGRRRAVDRPTRRRKEPEPNNNDDSGRRPRYDPRSFNKGAAERGGVNSPASVVPVLIFGDLYVFKGSHFWRYKNKKRAQNTAPAMTNLLFRFNDEPNLDDLMYVYQNPKTDTIGMIIGDEIYKFDRDTPMPDYPKPLPSDIGAIMSVVYEDDRLYLVTNQRKIVVLSESTVEIVGTIELQE